VGGDKHAEPLLSSAIPLLRRTDHPGGGGAGTGVRKSMMMGVGVEAPHNISGSIAGVRYRLEPLAGAILPLNPRTLHPGPPAALTVSDVEPLLTSVASPLTALRGLVKDPRGGRPVRTENSPCLGRESIGVNEPEERDEEEPREGVEGIPFEDQPDDGCGC